jgi:hypothetical protein
VKKYSLYKSILIFSVIIFQNFKYILENCHIYYMLGLFYLIYMKIREWNHQRLKRRRQGKMLKAFVEKFNKNLAGFSRVFEDSHQKQVKTLYLFHSWQTGRLKEHIQTTTKIKNECIENFDTSYQDITEKINSINTNLEKFKKEMNNIVCNKIEFYAQKNAELLSENVQKAVSQKLHDYEMMSNDFNQQHQNQLKSVTDLISQFNSLEKREEKSILQLQNSLSNLQIKSKKLEHANSYVCVPKKQPVY